MANQNDAVLEALSLAVAVRVPVLLWGPEPVKAQPLLRCVKP